MQNSLNGAREYQNSTHKAEVVNVTLENHPNADKLSIIKIFNYVYVGNTQAWEGVTKGVYFPPDTLLPIDRPEFASLVTGKETLYYADGNSTKQVSREGEQVYYRVKAKNLRGVNSFGFMIPAPEWANLGDDLAGTYGIQRYNEPEKPASNKGIDVSSNEVASAPPVTAPKYDVESLQRYAAEVMIEGEPVFVTEKLDGENARFVFLDGSFHCGSRTEWKKEYGTPPNVEKIVEQMQAAGSPADRIEKVKEKLSKWQPSQNKWWKALRATPELMDWLRSHPGTVVYGELYGGKGGFPYDTVPGNPKIAVFDILAEGKWMDAQAARLAGPELPWVPTISEAMPFNIEKLIELSEGMSTLNDKHIREGIVVSPLKERWHPSVGRVKLKVVSATYLDKRK